MSNNGHVPIHVKGNEPRNKETLMFQRPGSVAT